MPNAYETVPKSDVILEGVVGSTAYGLSTPSSDIDFLGITCLENNAFFRLDKPSDTVVLKNPDRTYHELNKFVRLLCNANPTISELLWLGSYSRITPQGKHLLDVREMFLTQQVRTTYGGYAKQQARRLTSQGSFTRRRRTEKHGRHCCRLILQCQYILEHKRIKIKLSRDEIDLCFYAGRLARNNPDAFGILFEEMLEWLDCTSDNLPRDVPMYEANKLILSIRGLL